MPDYIEEYLRQIMDDRDINQWDTLYTHLDAKEPLLMSVRLQDERGDRDELDVEDVVAQEKRLIISGASGMGKTTTLKWLTLVYAEKCLGGAERLIPFYVDLGRFRHGLFYDHALMIAHENGLEEVDFKELLDDGKLAIFLDGLDLLGGSKDFEPVAEIQNFMSEFSRCKFVLSSRPGFFEGFKSSCKVSELVELYDPKIKGYIHKYLGEGDKADTLISRIFDGRNERLKLLCKNPMMLHLVIKMQKDGKMADGRAGIYRESVEGIITHYREKGKTLSSNGQLVRDVLKELAFSMQKENAVRLDCDSALDVVGSCTFSKRYRRVSADQVLDDCFRLGLLNKDDGEVGFGFHQSFQEYFAAVKLKEMFEQGYGISESFSHPKWEDTLVFLSEITERPDELFDDVIGADKMFLAARLTAHVEDRRVENLCALLLDKVDSGFDLEKEMVVESFTYIGDRAADALLEILISEDEGMMCKAVVAFRKIGVKKGAEPLINALRDEDPVVRITVAWALRKIGGEWTVEPLINALRDEDPVVRITVAWALEMIGGLKAMKLLIVDTLRDDPEVRKTALWALEMIGGEIPLERPLIIAPHNDDSEMGVMIVETLETIGAETFINVLHADNLHDDDLPNDDPEPKKTALWALGKLGKNGDERAVELLITALHDDPDTEVRMMVAETLETIGDERFVEPLITALHDDDPRVQERATQALVGIGDEINIDIEPFINALHDDDPMVRGRVAWILGRIEDLQAVAPEVRKSVAWALG